MPACSHAHARHLHRERHLNREIANLALGRGGWSASALHGPAQDVLLAGRSAIIAENARTPPTTLADACDVVRAMQSLWSVSLSWRSFRVRARQVPGFESAVVGHRRFRVQSVPMPFESSLSSSQHELFGVCGSRGGFGVRSPWADGGRARKSVTTEGCLSDMTRTASSPAQTKFGDNRAPHRLLPPAARRVSSTAPHPQPNGGPQRTCAWRDGGEIGRLQLKRQE